MIQLSPVRQDIFPAPQPRSGLRQELEEKAKWLINLRWLVVTAQLLCAVPGLTFGLLPAASLPVYLLVVCSLAVFNLVVPRIAARLAFADEWFLFLNLAIDLAALGVLLLLSHGYHNPLVALIYLNAALGPLILSGVRNLVFLAATGLCLVAIRYLTATPPHHNADVSLSGEIELGAELTVVALIWQLARWVAENLTRLSRSINELERRQGRMDTLRALGAMAASFSHAFATPLNTVKMRLERSMKSTGLDERIGGDLSSALSAVKQCENVLRSLFNVESDIPSAPIEKLVIANFVEAVAHNWCRDHGNISLKVTADEDARVTVCQVPGLLLARSLIDLLDNAVEAVPAGAAIIHIGIGVTGENARIDIEDCGPGIAAAVKAQLGKPFLTTRPEGAGLGLFTAQSLAEALGGNLEVRDRVGGGTIVTLTLPVCGESR